MNAVNIYHVLADGIQELERGVRLSPQDSIASKTLVCFLDENDQFHFGFAYKNGSNLRVVCWENKAIQNRTTPKGAFIIAFDQVRTQKPRGGNFDAKDFNFEWLDANARQILEKELKTLNELDDTLNELIEKIAGLTVQELHTVNQKIDKLRNK